MRTKQTKRHVISAIVSPVGAVAKHWQVDRAQGVPSHESVTELEDQLPPWGQPPDSERQLGARKRRLLVV